MAQATVTYTLNDDETLTCEVECESTRPDALDELAHRVRELFRDTLGDLMGVTRTDANDGTA